MRKHAVAKKEDVGFMAGNEEEGIRRERGHSCPQS
jgi:hypothetical protein